MIQDDECEVSYRLSIDGILQNEEFKTIGKANLALHIYLKNSKIRIIEIIEIKMRPVLSYRR